MIKFKAYFSLLFVLQSIQGTTQVVAPSNNYSPRFEQLVTDSLFDSKQVISIISLPISTQSQYSIKIVYDQQNLRLTSAFASEENALAGINGSFFNMQDGGSTTYLEIEDSLIASSGPKQLPDSLLNGVVIINNENQLRIEIKQPDSVYLNSTLEKAVLGSGPILLLDSKKLKMLDKKFVANRHPRSCLCITLDTLLLITIDGRNRNAAGMSLYELQDFLLSKNCTDAINLDGGGSTTLWMSEAGIVNFPSDKTGERKVANAIVIVEKQ